MPGRSLADDAAGNALASDYAILRIDNVVPGLNAVYTGHAWKAAEGDDPAQNNEDAGVRTSVRVQFTEPLDPGTVETSDFSVGGAAPLGRRRLLATAST